MNLKEKAQEAKKLQLEYLRLYDLSRDEEAHKKELEYLDARREVILSVNSQIARRRSLPIREVRKMVEAMPETQRRETGISSLDYELLPSDKYGNGRKGGFAIGNFIQIVGSRGSGKSSFMMKILTGISRFEQVAWFDFEMGERRVISKLKSYLHDEDNLLYYNGSRSIEEVTDEIKLLNAEGVSHIVIDSTMKITVAGVDRYEKFSSISGKLSELTSQFGINIYIINQISQYADREGHLSIKHGNDAEYDADFIFYLLNKPTDEEDEAGRPVPDENVRILKCEKNRQDERLFTVEIPKYEIIGYQVEVSEYSEGA